MCLTRSIHVSGDKERLLENKTFQVAGIQSETEALRCLLWMEFHRHTEPEPAAEGDGWRRWWFIRWPTNTNTNTNTHTLKGPTH